MYPSNRSNVDELVQLIDRLPVGVFRTTPEGRIVTSNRALVTMLGYRDAAELQDVDVASLYVDPERRERMKRRVAAGESLPAEEITLRRADGSLIHCRVRSHGIRDDNGETLYYEGVLEDITELRAAEDALAASELQFSTVFERAPQGIAVLDPRGVVVRANPAFAELIGSPPTDVVGQNSHDFIVPDDRDDARQALDDLLSGRVDRYTAERHLRRVDGEMVSALIDVRAIRRPDGSVKALISQQFDITERKAEQERIIASEALFRCAFEDAPAGMVISRTDLTPIRANPALLNMLGVDEETFLALPVQATMQRDAIEDAKRRIANIQPGGAYTVERTLRRSDGTPIHTIFSVSPVFDASNRLRLLLTQVVDVTEFRRVEESLRLRELENQLLLDAIPNLMFRMDRAGRYLDYRPGKDGRLYVPPEQFLGANVRDVMPDMADAVLERIEQALTSQESQRLAYELTIDGELRHYEATFSPIHGDEVLAMVRDTTEQVQARQRLEELVQAKDDLVASVSHELRTPLTTIVGLAEELADADDFASDERDELMRLIAQQAGEMASLIEDLLVAARSELGMVTVAPAVVDLEEQVSLVLDAFSGPNFDPWIESASVKAIGDPIRIRQVVRNLVSNAVRYGRPPFSVRVNQFGATASIEVIDAGAPLPPEDREAIFEPYRRAHAAAGVTASVGLGLAVSRHLARLMGGDVAYRPGFGYNAFVFTLPVATDDH